MPMHDASFTAIQVIQAILAPAIGISAVALLLLGLLNRYSGLVNRIRLLNDEKRSLTKQLTEHDALAYEDTTRFMSIRKQTDELVIRSGMVRTAILMMQAAVGMFVVTSIGIGLNLFLSGEAFRILPLIVFLAGMLCVVAGIVLAGLEIQRSFKIVLIEVKGEE